MKWIRGSFCRWSFGSTPITWNCCPMFSSMVISSLNADQITHVYITKKSMSAHKRKSIRNRRVLVSLKSVVQACQLKHQLIYISHPNPKSSENSHFQIIQYTVFLLVYFIAWLNVCRNHLLSACQSKTGDNF